MDNGGQQIKEIVTHLINEMEDSKLDGMLTILHNASDNSDKIDEKN